MTELIEKIKNAYRRYAQLMTGAVLTLLCLYVISVNAADQPLKTAAVYIPTKLVVNTQQLKETTVSNDKQALNLQVTLPDKLDISAAQIVWQIKQSTKVIRKLTGNHHALNLDTGLYVVRLQIGRYSTEKQLLVQEHQQLRPYFRADVGYLQVHSDYPVKWQIEGPDKIRYQTKQQSSLNEIVPTGEYRVKALLPTLSQQHNISVKVGQQATHRVSIPLSKVNLMAVRNHQLLLKPMDWEVFRLDRDQRYSVGKYRLHSNSIQVPPGQYEAVVKHANKVSKRRFWVQKETTNKVMLVME